MAQATADFELGTQGNTIATTDAGSANAWDLVNIGVNSAVTYDNTHAYATLAGKLHTGTPGNAAQLEWLNATLGAITDAYGRFYIWTAANPASAMTFALFRSTGTIRCRLNVSSTGKLTVQDSANVTQATSTNSIGLSQQVRVEFHVTFSATLGFMEIKLFNSPDSATPTETLTSAANLNFGGASANEFLLGPTGGINGLNIWTDNIVWGAASYPGPAAPPVKVTPTIVTQAVTRSAYW